MFYDNAARNSKWDKKNGSKNVKKNALECQKACVRREGCTFWGYDLANGWCYHNQGERKEYKKLNAKNRRIAKDTYMTGDKDCVPQDIPENARRGGRRSGRGRRRRRGRRNG